MLRASCGVTGLIRSAGGLKTNKNTKILLYDATYQLAQRLWMSPMTVRAPLWF